MNREKFEILMRCYARHLAVAVAKSPKDFKFGLDRVPQVVAVMRQDVALGRFRMHVKPDPAMVAACQELGITASNRGVDIYLERLAK